MKYFLYLLLVIGAIPLAASAQGFDQFLGESQTQLSVVPAQPKPGQQVNVQIDNASSQLFGGTVVWRYNGEEIADSNNRRSVEITAGELGQTGAIEATIISTNGAQQTLRTSINPTYLDIIVEPQTRVPHWYAGRAMPSIGSQVNVTALVNNGEFLNPANLVYTWRIDNRVIEGGAIRGRNKLTITTPRGQDFILSVSIARTSGEVVATRSVEVDSVSPMLRFYEQHSLYGSSQFPLSNASPFVGNTLTVQAEPYYLDTRVYNDPGLSEWEINLAKTDNGSLNPYEVTLQRTAASGQTRLNFHVRSLQTVLQGVEDSVTLTF